MTTAVDVSQMSNQFQKTFKMAVALHNIKQLVNSKMVDTYIMPLQNTNLGFKTDKKDTGYPLNVVMDVAIEAFTLGLPISGNCINIIGGNLMVVKNGVDYMVEQLGVNHIVEIVNVEILRAAEYKNGKAIKGRCRAEVKLSFDGKDGREEKSVTVTAALNSGQTEDAASGKIERKALVWLYKYLTKIHLPSMDADDAQQQTDTNNITEAMKKTSGKREKKIEEAEQVVDVDIILAENNLDRKDLEDFANFKKTAVETVENAFKKNPRSIVEKIQAWRV